MILLEKPYGEIRPSLAAGDLIAFGGSEWVSRAIMLGTRSAVSHVGIVSRIGVDGVDRVVVLESTTLNGQAGVQENFLSQRVAEYEGRMWVLRLDAPSRNRFDAPRFERTARAMLGRAYDAPGALLSALEWFHIASGYNRMYCSEVVATALREAGVLPFDTDCDITPIEACRLPVWDTFYYQIKGKRKEI